MSPTHELWGTLSNYSKRDTVDVERDLPHKSPWASASFSEEESDLGLHSGQKAKPQVKASTVQSPP